MNHPAFKKEYNVWLYIYIAANIIGALIMWDTGHLIGDVVDSRLYSQSALLWVLLLVVASYYILLKPLYNGLFRIRIPQVINLNTDARSGMIVGIIMVVLQVGGMSFNLIEGVNTASVVKRSDSPFAIILIFLPVDLMFLVYYSLFRKSPMFKYNLAVYMVSNIIRGWAAVMLYVMFFEWCRMVRERKINFGLIALLGLFSFFMYPYFLYVKFVFRSMGANSEQLSSFFTLFNDALQSRGYMEFLEEGVSHLVGRLQITSVVLEIAHYKERLQEMFASGDILPFWNEGLPQMTYRKVMGIAEQTNIGVFLTTFFFPENLIFEGKWNINSGYVGWFFVAPQYIVFYLTYTLLLCFAMITVAKQFPEVDSRFDVVWMAWLVYLLPAWFTTFINVIYSMILLMAIIKLAQLLGRIRVFPSVSTETDSTIHSP